MTAFKDAQGRSWTISLDGITLKELRDAQKIDLSDVVGAVYGNLKRDPALLVSALAFLLADQIKAQNMTARQFAAAVVGKSLEDAYSALWRAAELFFPPSLWSALSTRLEQQEQTEKIRDAIESLAMLDKAPQEIRDQVWETIGKKLPTDLQSLKETLSATGQESILSMPATNSPDSAASTPAA